MTTNMVKPSAFEIGRHMMSTWVPQAVHAAAELGVADALADGPASAAEVATRLQTHPDATRRLLEALSVLELVRRDAQGYALTELGEFLRSDAPSSRRAWARLMGGEQVWRAWGQLTRCVRTGEPAFAVGPERRSETETFDALFADPEAATVFHQAMADGTRDVARGVVEAIDFGEAESVVDVGGGFGALLCAALDAYPRLRGWVFDLEHARDGAEKMFEERGLVERASFVAGDLFREAPPRADVMLLKSVLHDWSDERSLAVLERCRDAMGTDDRMVVVEPAAPPPDASVPPGFAWIVAFSDLNMLVNTGGRERTAGEYTALVEQAGMRVLDVRPTAGGFYSVFVCAR